jgi:hypothetical protein
MKYDQPKTPCNRLIASAALTPRAADGLTAIMLTLDRLQLLGEIRTMQRHLTSSGSDRDVHVLPNRHSDLEASLAGLATAWKRVEPRPTHQRAPKPKQYCRTRKDLFERVWPEILDWLHTDGDRTAKELLERLQNEYPGEYADGQISTLQHKVGAWREANARRLVLAFSPGGESAEKPSPAEYDSKSGSP